jgi:hypothetical protein
MTEKQRLREIFTSHGAFLIRPVVDY